MSGDMLMSFESPTPAKAKNAANLPARGALSRPLIPCPSNSPFDWLSSQPGDDPFELLLPNSNGLKGGTLSDVKTNTPERSSLAPPVLHDVPPIDAATPSPLLGLRRTMSDMDISGVVPGQFLVSSTPLVSNANTPTRSTRKVPRRSVLSGDESISALIKSKLELINKVNQSLAGDGERPSISKSKSISNLPETLNTSVQHKLFSRSKTVVLQEPREIARVRQTANLSVRMGSSRANSSLFVPDQDDTSKLETSAYMSFLTSPKHIKGNANITPDELREEALKMQLLFSLSAADNYKLTNESEEGIEWFQNECLPDNWFDASLDFDHLHSDSDSDEDVVNVRPKRVSTKDEMEAIKVRLTRFRKSVGLDEEKPLQESKTEDPVVPRSAAPDAKLEAAAAVDTPSVAALLVASGCPVGKMPRAPELKPKAAKAAPAKKGPLKAVEPVPNMMKKYMSSDVLLKNKPGVARGRLTRPSSELGSRRPALSSARRSNSVSPSRSATAPVKTRQPLVKPTAPKLNPVAVKGKENRA